MSPDAATQPPQPRPRREQHPQPQAKTQAQAQAEPQAQADPLPVPQPQVPPQPESQLPPQPEPGPGPQLPPQTEPQAQPLQAQQQQSLQLPLAASAPVPVWPRYAFPAFVWVGVLNLIFEAAGPRGGFDLTKPLLMPLLGVALLAKARRVPPLLLVALLGSTLGDTMLLFSGTWFLVGMAGFAATHVCYITLFRRGGVGGMRRNRGRFAAAAVFYGVLWIVLITNLWSGLVANMRIPVAGYSLLLVFMAIHAFAAGRRTGLGGALFLVSDTMIAGGLAHWHMPRGTGFAIMATYVLGQYLLATGLMDFSARRHPLRPAP